MFFNYNVWGAYDKNDKLVAEFTEYEDAAKFYHEHNKEYKILLYNKKINCYFVVPDYELQLSLIEE